MSLAAAIQDVLAGTGSLRCVVEAGLASSHPVVERLSTRQLRYLFAIGAIRAGRQAAHGLALGPARREAIRGAVAGQLRKVRAVRPDVFRRLRDYYAVSVGDFGATGLAGTRTPLRVARQTARQQARKQGLRFLAVQA